MRHYLLRNRDFLENAVLALVLPFVAGSVNASGFFIVGGYTSHMTGNVARIGDELAQGHVLAAVSAAFLVATFYVGAVVGTALVERRRAAGKSRYAAALGLEAATLFLVALLGVARPKQLPFLGWITTALLCLAMGAQNALVTKLSGAVVRTTHLTGVVTDIGIETIRAVSWFRGAARGRPLWQLGRLVLQVREHPELKRLRLLVAIFLSFLVGAIVGPFAYLRHGYVSMALPLLVLALLIAFDVLVGFRTRGEAAAPPAPER
jgi:uncharacterized membrane protein YoaK (UPF0700 family)